MSDLDEVLVHIDYLKGQLADILEHLDRQNGRLRTSEIEIAVLRDRSPGRSAATWGASAGAIAVAVSEVIRMLM